MAYKIFCVISICLGFESADASDSIISVWIQMSRLIWSIEGAVSRGFGVLGQFSLKLLLWGFNHKQNASIN